MIPSNYFNGSGLAPLPNPWINGSYSTTFDQGLFLLFVIEKELKILVVIEIYLIMNVDVGSSNGWFPDGQGKKPWLNHAQSMFFGFCPLHCPNGPNLSRDSLIRPNPRFYNSHR